LVTSENCSLAIQRSAPAVAKSCSSPATFNSSVVFSWEVAWEAV
jgi:hypothetical protein